jgi:hypothetical protein
MKTRAAKVQKRRETDRSKDHRPKEKKETRQEHP